MTKKLAFVVLALLLFGVSEAVAQPMQCRVDPTGGWDSAAIMYNPYCKGMYERAVQFEEMRNDVLRMREMGRMGGMYGIGSGSRYGNYYPGMRIYDPFMRAPVALQECKYQECQGLLGTFHADKGQLHFRPYDDTNSRLGTMSAGALGAGGGALIGSLGGRNGAAIGGVAGGILGGIMGSKRTHGNCMLVNQSAQSVSGEQELNPSANQLPAGYMPAQAPAYREQVEEVNFQVSNRTRFSIEVFDGNELRFRLSPGASQRVGAPKSNYRAEVLRPNVHGAVSRDRVDLTAVNDGWAFIEPSFGG